MDQHQETLASLTQAIAQNPTDARALAQRGETYCLLNRYSEALADFDRALELKPDYAWVLAHRGETHRLLGRYRTALADFNHALQLNPEHAWTLAHRGVIYELMGAYPEAMTDFDRAVELMPDYAWSLVHRGITYMELRLYEKALADLERALALDETILSSGPGEYGLALNFLGRYAEAADCCEQGLQVNPNDHIALYGLAVAKVRWQGAVEAQAEIDKALTKLHTLLSAATSPDEQACVLYRLGGLAALVGQAEQALAYLQEAASLDYQPVKLARHDPAWLDLRTDARFQALIASVISEK